MFVHYIHYLTSFVLILKLYLQITNNYKKNKTVDGELSLQLNIALIKNQNILDFAFL